MAFIQHSAEVSSATPFPSTAAALDVHVMENTPLMKVIMLSSILLESILIDFIRTDIKYLVLFKDSGCCTDFASNFCHRTLLSSHFSNSCLQIQSSTICLHTSGETGVSTATALPLPCLCIWPSRYNILVKSNSFGFHSDLVFAYLGSDSQHCSKI